MRPAIIPPTAIMKMKFLMMKVLIFSQVHISLETTHHYSRNNRGYQISEDGRGGSRSQDTSHYLSQNIGVYHFGVDGRGGTRSQDTIHSSSHNRVSIV